MGSVILCVYTRQSSYCPWFYIIVIDNSCCFGFQETKSREDEAKKARAGSENYGRYNNGRRQNRGRSRSGGNSLFCTFCRKNGHTIEKCHKKQRTDKENKQEKSWLGTNNSQQNLADISSSANSSDSSFQKSTHVRDQHICPTTPSTKSSGNPTKPTLPDSLPSPGDLPPSVRASKVLNTSTQTTKEPAEKISDTITHIEEKETAFTLPAVEIPKPSVNQDQADTAFEEFIEEKMNDLREAGFKPLPRGIHQEAAIVVMMRFSTQGRRSFKFCEKDIFRLGSRDLLQPRN